MKHHHAAGFLRSVQYKIIAVLAFFAIITSFIFTSTSRVEADELEWPEAPELVSGAAILMDADTGAILYEKNAYERNYPASTTKILTGLLVAQNNALSDVVTFSSDAANSVSLEDATLASKTGEQFTVEQALYGLLLHSANEMAYALAEHTSGSLSAFVDKMNETAKNAGALDTHFANASGLYDANHYTTAYDMALIARMCFNNPTFLTIDSATTYTIPATNKTSQERVFNNRNLLLPGRLYGYEYCVGGKTGFVGEGGYTYVSYAMKNGMRLICVCFKSTADGRFQDAKSLFEWGFNHFTKIPITGTALISQFSTISYLSSTRFNSKSVVSGFDGSYVTVPKDTSLGQVAIAEDSKHDVQSTDTEVDVPINFMYGDHVVGTANITFSSAESNQDESSLLPYADSSNSSNSSQPFAVVINVWIVVIALVSVTVIIIFVRRKKMIDEKSPAKFRRKRHYKKHR